MKQILLFFAAMLLCSCSSDSEVKAEVSANIGKTLVVYYSYTGNSLKHWHGAQKDSWFQHLTYHKDVEEGASNEWCEPVDDDTYSKVKH